MSLSFPALLSFFPKVSRFSCSCLEKVKLMRLVTVERWLRAIVCLAGQAGSCECG